MGVPFNVTWTDEQVAILKEGYDNELSFNGIAKLIFERTHVRYSRNAVIGKFHRLGLYRNRPKRTTSPNPMARLTKTKPRKGKRPGPSGPQLATIKVERAIDPGIEADGLRDLPPEVLSPNAVSIYELEEHHCRWPIGEPGTKEFRCCGNPKRKDPDYPNCPYCKAHAEIAYTGRSQGKYSSSFAAHYGS